MLEVGNGTVSKQDLKYLALGNEQLSKNFDMERASIMVKGGRQCQFLAWEAGKQEH